MTLRSSQAAIDLIVAEEVGSRAQYNAQYQHPEWPGGASGVTVGIGYDCGYSSSAGITSDWSGKIPDAMVQALAATAGITGSPAKSHAAELRHVVTIPWDAANAVFMDHDMPKWEATIIRSLVNTDKLAPDCFGTLVSIAYNRGASFHNAGDRYREMRMIADDMTAQTFDRIPDAIRAMKRLWPNMAGLRHRRDHEADLFELGLKLMANNDGATPGQSQS